MLRNYSVRTDLALEEKERFESDDVEIQGVVLEEDYDEEQELRVTRVEIRTENGAKAMGKPVGTYLTLETPNLAIPDDESHMNIAARLCGYIKELIRKNVGDRGRDLSVLVVGLGNREVTPDALGPYVALLNERMLKVRNDVLLPLDTQTNVLTSPAACHDALASLNLEHCVTMGALVAAVPHAPDRADCRYRNSSGIRHWK